METKSILAGVILLCTLANLTEGQQKCTYKFTVPDKEGCSSAGAAISDLQTQFSNLAEQNTVLQTQIANQGKQITVLQTQITDQGKQNTVLLNENVHWRNLVDKLLNSSAPSGGDGSSGAVYIRWGRTTCPDQSKRLYTGIAASSFWSHTGGLAELLCLPRSPQWGAYKENFQGSSYIFGTQYEMGHTYGGNGLFKGDNLGSSTLHHHDIPCSVCYTPGRAAAYKFPATLTCPDGWQEEYHGYLMAGRYSEKTKIQSVCLDEAPEVTEGSSRDVGGAHIYHMEARCGSLPCPNYVNGRELTCVICSR